jgi:hypothetical protein
VKWDLYIKEEHKTPEEYICPVKCLGFERDDVGEQFSVFHGKELTVSDQLVLPD